MKTYTIIWHESFGPNQIQKRVKEKVFSSNEEDYMNQFVRDLQERLNVTFIGKVTEEMIYRQT